MQQFGLICHINQSKLLSLSAQKVVRKDCFWMCDFINKPHINRTRDKELTISQFNSKVCYYMKSRTI